MVDHQLNQGVNVRRSTECEICTKCVAGSAQWTVNIDNIYTLINCCAIVEILRLTQHPYVLTKELTTKACGCVKKLRCILYDEHQIFVMCKCWRKFAFLLKVFEWCVVKAARLTTAIAVIGMLTKGIHHFVVYCQHQSVSHRLLRFFFREFHMSKRNILKYRVFAIFVILIDGKKSAHKIIEYIVVIIH